MEFTNEFTVPTDVETAFAILTDLEKVAPCLPGAQLEEVEGDVYTGRVKVKVGPISMTYRGQAQLAETDAEAKRARIQANGKETRGTGTAKADVHAALRPDGDGTVVTVVTDLTVTGKPAQFGRGVMAEVGTKIIDSFAERLRAMLDEEHAGAGAGVGAGVGTGVPAEESVVGEAAAVATPASEAAQAAMTSAAAEAALEEAAAGAVETGGAPGGAPTGAEAATLAAPAWDGAPPAPRRRRIEPDLSREDDALDLMEVAGAATFKRVAPVVAVLALLVTIFVFWRRTSQQREE
ncbi:SRPBCC family protein [Egicoccus sp. AB-alg2]|uniref:SRPBCC family protein n=1 Tax=Egicoccus sp. AB-alg2 TaxID=3242693 RepID=UPI00359D18D6